MIEALDDVMGIRREAESRRTGHSWETSRTTDEGNLLHGWFGCQRNGSLAPISSSTYSSPVTSLLNTTLTIILRPIWFFVETEDLEEVARHRYLSL